MDKILQQKMYNTYYNMKQRVEKDIFIKLKIVILFK